MNVNYRVVIGNDTTAQPYGGVDALPTTFLIDRKGKIAAIHVGLASQKDFEDGVAQLLEAPGGTQDAALLAAWLCLPLLYAQTSGYLSVGEPQKVVGKRNAAVEVKIPVVVQTASTSTATRPAKST